MENKRFHIRDIETKEIRETFKSETAARQYLINMKFSLGNYYEVYDSGIDKVIYKFSRNKINRCRSF